MRKLFILVFIVLSAITLNAQHHHDHSHSSLELGFGLGVAPIVDEGTPLSAHVHLMKSFESLDRFQFGVGLERLFDDHKHTSIGLIVSYNIFNDFYLGVSPGILFTKHDVEWENHLAVHFELHYEIEWQGIHIGPLLEYAYSKEDKHYMVGIHLGVGL